MMKSIFLSSIIFTLLVVLMHSCNTKNNSNNLTVASTTTMEGNYLGTYQGTSGAGTIQTTSYVVTVTRVSTNEVVVDGDDFQAFHVTVATSGSSASASNNSTNQFAYSANNHSLTFQFSKGFSTGQFSGRKQ